VRLLFAFILAACFAPPVLAGQELRVLTYDSLAASDGLGPVLFAGFEKQCGCKVRVQSVGDAAQMVSRLELEKAQGGIESDVLVGIDQTLWPSLRGSAIDLGVRFPLAGELGKFEPGFVPLDWGVMALMVDSERAGQPAEFPRSWRDLGKTQLKKRFILQDPRTSTPGLGFVWGATAALGESEAKNFFAAIRSQWLTLAPGWSGAYGLFLRGEAPFVWSYTTSEAYHRQQEQKSGSRNRYRALVFDEGNPLQVEGAVAVRKSELARKFLQFMVSPPVQAEIPLKQWMYPARKGIRLPPSFERLPMAKRTLRWPAGPASAEWVRRWEEWIR